MSSSSSKPQILEHSCKSLNATIYDSKWIPNTARFVVLGSLPKSTGFIQVFELEGNDIERVGDCEHVSGFKCGTFGAAFSTDDQLATGAFDGKLSLWNLEDLRSAVADVQAHQDLINAVDGYGGLCDGHGPPEIATAGRDGCVRVFDVRELQSPVASFEPKDGNAKRECWAVALGNSFNDAERCLLAGYDNGDVKLFDLRTNAVRWETNVKNGVCSVQFDRADIEMNKFVVSCLESQVHLFDARTQHPQKGFAQLTETSKFKSTCWGARHVPQNRDLFMLTHGDGSLALFQYHYPSQRKLKGRDGQVEGVVGSLELLNHSNFSSQPISCFDWSPNKEGLFICGALDQCIRVGFVTKLNKI